MENKHNPSLETLSQDTKKQALEIKNHFKEILHPTLISHNEILDELINEIIPVDFRLLAFPKEVSEINGNLQKLNKKKAKN